MKSKIFLSTVLVLLLSITVNAQVQYNRVGPPTKVVYVNHPAPAPVYHHGPAHHNKHYKKVRPVKRHKKVIVPKRVVYVPRPGVDVMIHKPGKVNIGVRVTSF